MSELNERAALTLAQGMTLLGKSTLTLRGDEVLDVSKVLDSLFALYTAIADNTIQLISLEQEAGPDPKESEDVASTS